MLKRLKEFRFREMGGVLLVFLIMAAILFLERAGVQIGALAVNDPYFPREETITKDEALASLPSTCLVISDLGNSDSAKANKQFVEILKDIKVKADFVDIGSQSLPASFDKYSKMIILTPYVSPYGDRVTEIVNWVEKGGGLLMPVVSSPDPYTQYLVRMSGAVEIGSENVVMDTIYPSPDFMLGGGRSYAITDAFDSSLFVQLDDETKTYAWIEHQNGIPLIWSKKVGNGYIAVDNLGIYDKEYRGFYSATYLLTGDVEMYPVIDGAVMFLDDMPSPVPLGDSHYIYRDYRTSIADYYVNTWYPDMANLKKNYNIPFVGLIIENYEKDTDGTTERQPETSRFTYFGNQLLRSGNELGYHGYNHQPLCPPTMKYPDEFDYDPWKSVDAMSKGIEELMNFSKELYPTAMLSCYVPPSNILSDEGRKYIGSLYPEVRTISGSYYPRLDGVEFVQEFGVAEDGIVDLPRITSGSIIEDYTLLSALSELNMHMVFSHFIHPDDAMDVDRGAEIGWKELYRRLDGFCNWVRDSAPTIRGINSAEMSKTIQQWSAVTIDKEWSHEEDRDVLTVKLGNFLGEARLYMRFNNGVADKINGADVTRLSDSLYLVVADNPEFTIEWKR